MTVMIVKCTIVFYRNKICLIIGEISVDLTIVDIYYLVRWLSGKNWKDRDKAYKVSNSYSRDS